MSGVSEVPNPKTRSLVLEVLGGLGPLAAARTLQQVLAEVLANLDESEKAEVIMGLAGEPGEDKVSSLVHLWLAECLGEGVDPTKMCQTLVERVARSEQLQAVAEPDVLILFEDWMEELELEAVDLLRGLPEAGPDQLAKALGISPAGAQFLLTKLKKAGKP